MLRGNPKIFVAGHRGLVGSAMVRKLESAGYTNLLLAGREELDLRDQASVDQWFAANKPEYVFHAAGTVGGIIANATRPAEFIYDNMMLHATVLHSAYRHGCRKLIYLGSSCIYPRDCPQPIKEEYLLAGPLEPTNRPYALAKIAGIELCWSYNRQYGTRFIAAMPTNLYGYGDNYDLMQSHVLPAMIRKLHLAKLAKAGDVDAIRRNEVRYGLIPDDLLSSMGLRRDASGFTVVGTPVVSLWGTGTPRREFLHVDDMVDACLYLLEQPEDKLTGLFNDEQPPLVNIGCGEDISIRDLAYLVSDIVGFDGEIAFDDTKPDGTPRKLMDIGKLRQMGWAATMPLRQGISRTYLSYSQNDARGVPFGAVASNSEGEVEACAMTVPN